MFLEYFGLRENPFNVTSDPDFLYLSHTHKEALSHLLYGIHERKGYVALTGEVGSGKTTICRALLNRRKDCTKTSLVLNPDLPERQLLQAILQDFGITPKHKNKFELINQLNEFLLQELSRGNNAVLILDEAQNIKMSTLETIRLLSNLETEKEKLLQIILVGQPELRDKLNSPKLLQLRQRLSVRYHIEPLSKEEVSEYIDHRLYRAGASGRRIFSEETEEPIFNYSNGIPRIINLICDKSLLSAYGKGTKQVTKQIVESCIDELESQLTLAS